MSLKEILEPIIITYNRKACLEKTLNQLVADNSPLKNCEIKILDNCSTDGTKEFCEKFCAEYNNFTYIRNSKNIGISGNIIEAMKIASKKWLWILCDDDDFHWTGWKEIEEALYLDFDAVHTRQNICGCNDYPHLINDEAFLPNVIYNTKHITDIVLQNAYGIAHTLCPHHAIGCKIINENGKIFVPQNTKDIMNAGLNDVAKKDWFRIPKQDLYYKFAKYNILVGYINSYVLIQDKKMRAECMKVLCQGCPFDFSIKTLLEWMPDIDSINSILEICGNFDSEMQESLYNILFEKNCKLNKAFMHFYKNLKTSYYRKFLIAIFSITETSTHKIIKIFNIKIKIRKVEVCQ